MPRLAKYVGLLVDVLGQGVKLEKLHDLPKTNDEYLAAIEILKQTHGVVDGVKRSFDGFYSGYFKSGSPTGYTVFDAQLSSVKVAKIIRTGFSDTIIHLAPLVQTSSHTPQYALSAMLSAASATMMASLAAGSPIRGAIEVGVLLDLDDGNYYGPLYQSLHWLEKKAEWPRIVVGPRLMKMLETANTSSPSKGVDEIRRLFAVSCLNEIDRQGDMPMLDMTLIDENTQDDKIREMIKLSYKYTLDMYQRFEGDPKLGERYNKLLGQFHKRQHKWT